MQVLVSRWRRDPYADAGKSCEDLPSLPREAALSCAGREIFAETVGLLARGNLHAFAREISKASEAWAKGAHASAQEACAGPSEVSRTVPPSGRCEGGLAQDWSTRPRR